MDTETPAIQRLLYRDQSHFDTLSQATKASGGTVTPGHPAMPSSFSIAAMLLLSGGSIFFSTASFLFFGYLPGHSRRPLWIALESRQHGTTTTLTEGDVNWFIKGVQQVAGLF